MVGGAKFRKTAVGLVAMDEDNASKDVEVGSSPATSHGRDKYAKYVTGERAGTQPQEVVTGQPASRGGAGDGGRSPGRSARAENWRGRRLVADRVALERRIAGGEVVVDVCVVHANHGVVYVVRAGSQEPA